MSTLYRRARGYKGFVKQTSITHQLGSLKNTRPIFLAKCHASPIPNATKIVIKTLEFNEFLKMHFPKFEPFYAHDPNLGVKVGDIVLVEKLEKQMTRDITHKILQLVYPMGDVRDPVTGKLCVGTEFREDMERRDELWGKNPAAFDYSKAPPRGWQEGKKDFSHRVGGKRWHEFTDRDLTEYVWE